MASTTSSTQPIRRFIKRQAVEEITGLSCSEIYRRIAAGTFPAQVILGPKSVVWIESEVMDWCDARVAESRGVCRVPRPRFANLRTAASITRLATGRGSSISALELTP